MYKGKKETFFDVRVIRRNLEKGLLSHEDYNEYLSKLEDTADKGVNICIDELDQDIPVVEEFDKN